MENLKTYVGQFLLVGAAVLAGLYTYEYLNKPKIAPPATAPVEPE